jgi:hypothetical protein
VSVFLEAVKLNHDGAAATSDALNIRRNKTTAVNVPEWVRGVSTTPEDAPAAYSIAETKGNTLTIQARFSTDEKKLMKKGIQVPGAIPAARAAARGSSSGSAG